MPKKYRPDLLTFLSSLGSHRPGSVSNDLNIDSFLKNINSDSDTESKFKNADDTLNNIQRFSEGLRFSKKIVTGLTSNGDNSLLNFGASLVSYLSKTDVQPIGKNDAIIHKTHTHIGKKSKGKIKLLKKNPLLDVTTKTFSDSLSDYQGHTKREQLKIVEGFNQKNFTFLMEDSIFTVEDIFKLFKVNKRFKKDFQDDDSLKEVFGCILKNHFQIKIKNRLVNYSSHIKIHLIKITDNSKDIRNLIESITHNSTIGSQDTAGRIPKKFQFSDPITTNKSNKISCSFLTDLRAGLNQSTRFKETAKIVKSWQMTLPPSSIWEFNLTTHYGEGIHLNTIYDLYKNAENYKDQDPEKSEGNIIEIDPLSVVGKSLKETIENWKDRKEIRIDKRKWMKILQESEQKTTDRKNLYHPINYVFCIETVGDRRGSIERVKEGDVFGGYSPSFLTFEFLKNMTFLTEQENEDNLCVYKKIQQDRDFDESSEFHEIFNPTRTSKLNVNFEDISFPGQKQNDSCAFKMDYDKILLSEPDYPGILGTLTSAFANSGLGENESMEDDINPKFTPDRPESPREDEDDVQDLDEDNPKNNTNFRGG